jgi:hypothetical protein
VKVALGGSRLARLPARAKRYRLGVAGARLLQEAYGMSAAKRSRSGGGDASPPGSESASRPHGAEHLLTLGAVARLLACSPKSVYSWAAHGLLPAVRLGD